MHEIIQHGASHRERRRFDLFRLDAGLLVIRKHRVRQIRVVPACQNKRLFNRSVLCTQSKARIRSADIGDQSFNLHDKILSFSNRMTHTKGKSIKYYKSASIDVSAGSVRRA